MARARRAPRFPWTEAVPGLLLGIGGGTAVAIALGQSLAGVTTPPVPFPDTWVYGFTTPSLLVVTVLGSVGAALGFVWRAERQFFNYLLIGSGLGVLLLGTSFLALEQVKVTPDAVVHRSWWGLFRVELQFDKVRLLREVKHHRAGRRNHHWDSLHYETHDGREGTLCDSTNHSRLFFGRRFTCSSPPGSVTSRSNTNTTTGSDHPVCKTLKTGIADWGQKRCGKKGTFWRA